MARFYADEDFDYGIIAELRLLGHDVVTVAESGRRGGTDHQVLVHATAASRVVLTFNRWDFVRLHQQDAAHSGIVSCTEDDPVGLARRIHAAIIVAGDMTGQHIRVNRLP